jgi:hypothetical protein
MKTQIGIFEINYVESHLHVYLYLCAFHLLYHMSSQVQYLNLDEIMCNQN